MVFRGVFSLLISIDETGPERGAIPIESMGGLATIVTDKKIPTVTGLTNVPHCIRVEGQGMSWGYFRGKKMCRNAAFYGC